MDEEYNQADNQGKIVLNLEDIAAELEELNTNFKSLVEVLAKK